MAAERERLILRKRLRYERDRLGEIGKRGVTKCAAIVRSSLPAEETTYNIAIVSPDNLS